MATVNTKPLTRTLAGSALQTSIYFDIDYVPPVHTTLNEKFGIQDGVAYPAGSKPVICALTIGNAGRAVQVGADGISYTLPLKHDPRDAACWNHIPLVLREDGNDLTAAEQTRYCLRARIQIDGIWYFAYYGLRIPVPETQPKFQYIKVTDGVATPIDFAYTSANLSPTVPELNEDGEIVTSGDYGRATTQDVIEFTAFDVAELKNVAVVLYGNENRAQFNELAYVAGCDKTVTVKGNSGSDISFNELVGATVVAFASGDYNAVELNDGFNITVDIGANEPLITGAYPNNTVTST